MEMVLEIKGYKRAYFISVCFELTFFFLDDGGVFKAKDTNKHTKGAREVGETKDTRTDLPIDQVPAEEVKVSQPRGHPLTH